MTSQNSRRCRIGNVLLAVGLIVAPAFAGPGDPVAISTGAEAMLKRTLGPAAAPAKSGDGRTLFESVLASESFRSGSVGPFDVHVLVGVGRSAAADAENVQDKVLATLAPASDLVARLWPAGGDGLISGTRFPVLIAANRTDYLQLVGLLDHCERAGYSGWAPANTLDSAEARVAEVAHTWEVQVFDLTHATIASRRDVWLAAGGPGAATAGASGDVPRCAGAGGGAAVGDRAAGASSAPALPWRPARRRSERRTPSRTPPVGRTAEAGLRAGGAALPGLRRPPADPGGDHARPGDPGDPAVAGPAGRDAGCGVGAGSAGPPEPGGVVRRLTAARFPVRLPRVAEAEPMTETPRETRGARARRRPRCAHRRRNGARTAGWRPAGSRRGGAGGGVEAGNGEDEWFRATSRGGARRGGGACLAYAPALSNGVSLVQP